MERKSIGFPGVSLKRTSRNKLKEHIQKIKLSDSLDDFKSSKSNQDEYTFPNILNRSDSQNNNNLSTFHNMANKAVRHSQSNTDGDP